MRTNELTTVSRSAPGFASSFDVAQRAAGGNNPLQFRVPARQPSVYIQHPPIGA